MQTIIEQMIAAMDAIKADINKVENKSAQARVRKNTLFSRSLARHIVRKAARNNQTFSKTKEVVKSNGSPPLCLYVYVEIL